MIKKQNPKITTEDLKLAVEKPDLYTIQCADHVFNIKDIPGKGKLLIYSLWDREKDVYNIQCADWLVECKAK
jgi:hypothetical protein